METKFEDIYIQCADDIGQVEQIVKRLGYTQYGADKAYADHITLYSDGDYQTTVGEPGNTEKPRFTSAEFIAKYSESTQLFTEAKEQDGFQVYSSPCTDSYPRHMTVYLQTTETKLELPIKWEEVDLLEVKESDIKNAQMRQEDNRPESERERAYRQKNEPAPTNEPLDVEIPEVTHCDFKGQMGWRG